VHSAAREIEGELPRVAQSIHDAAGRMEQASSSLRDRSADELLATIGQFARARPGTFFAGAVLAGFALSRFLKSSAEAERTARR
jgi:hypothetical protein